MESRIMRPILSRILVVGWMLLFGCVALLGIFPKLAILFNRIPHPEVIRPFLIFFVLISALYGIVSLYRQGMKRAKKKWPDGGGRHLDAPR